MASALPRPLDAARLTTLLVLMAGCFLSSAPSLFAQSTPAPPRPPEAAPAPQEPPDAAAGLQIYQERCERCHGSFGRGKGEMAAQLPVQPPSFADWRYLQAVVPSESFRIVTEGRIDNLMPPWAEALSEQERWNVLFGVWSYGLTPERMVRGREVWDVDCAACHGVPEPAGGAAEDVSVSAALPLSDPAFWLDRSLSQIRLAMMAAQDAAESHGSALEGRERDAETALAYARAAMYRPLPFDQLSLDGRIEGLVVNGSAGASAVAGAQVILVPFDGVSGEILPSEALSATVGSDGTFAFDGLLAGPDLAYRLVASYGGADYVSEQSLALPAGAGEPKRVELAVFENDPEAPVDARLAQIVLAPQPDEGSISVAEAWVIRNAGDRTRSAQIGGHVLRFDLPPGAAGLRFDDPRLQAGAEMDGDTVFTQMPIPPGETRIMLGYALPYEGTELDFERAMSLSVDELQIIAVGESVELESTTLDPPRIEQRGEDRVVLASATGLAADARLQARIFALPAAGSLDLPGAVSAIPEAVDHGLITRLGLGTMAVLALLALLFPALAAGLGLADDASSRRALRSELIGRIATLDRARERAELSDAEHARQRAGLFEQALAVARLDARKDEVE